MSDQEKIVEKYPVIQPHTFVQIVKENDGSLTYEVIEQPLTADEQRTFQVILDHLVEYPTVDGKTSREEKDVSKLKRIFRRKKTEKLNPSGYLLKDSTELKSLVESRKLAIVKNLKLRLTPLEFDKISHHLVKEILGFGKLEPLARDDKVLQIQCEEAGAPVKIEHETFGMMKTNVIFHSREELEKYISELAVRLGGIISERAPNFRVTLPRGLHVDLWLHRSSGALITIKRLHRT